MIALGSINTDSHLTPISRPIPECLKPPNGARGSCASVLTCTRPTWIRAAVAILSEHAFFYFAYDRLCQVGRRFLPGFYSEEGLLAFIDFVRAG